MKLRSILCGMLAIAAAVACKPDEVVETPKLDVDKTSVSVAATAGEATFNVTSNQDWTASADADWVTVTPNNAKAAEKAVAVKVTAEDNDAEAARTATVTVKAGELSKTVKVTQAGKTAEPAPEPEAATYVLVGEAVGGWDVDNNGVILTLADGYYTAKAVSVTAKKGMHFTKNNKWEGNVKGLHGLIAPNEIGEVGNNDISLTEGGQFDVYLTEALDKFYFMTAGKLPSEAVEHQDIAVTWGVCGAIEGNAWSTDVEFAADGEWLAAKGIVFTEVNFKIRGNNSWADDVKWGKASDDQVCELNKAIAVSTCTEYKAANPTAGDNPNIYIGGAGTYDVYFSESKKEVWVMTPGYKPGDEVPAEPGPDQPGDEKSDWKIVGSFTGEGWGWDLSAGLALDILDDNYFVYYGLDLADGAKFKFVKGSTWDIQVGAAYTSVEPNTIQVAGATDIAVAPAGKYDIYLAADASKFYVMSEGKTPSEATEPAPVEITYTIAGTIKDANWNNAYAPALMVKEGNFLVAKNLEFLWESTCYGGAEQIALKIFETGNWNAGYGASDVATYEANAEIPVVAGGANNINVVAPEGTYDVYFDKENGKLWVMTAGAQPGQTPDQPSQPDTPAMPEIPADYTATTLWEGSKDMAWGTAMQELAYGGYNWASCKPGQYLKLYVTPTDPSADWTVQLMYADDAYAWQAIPSFTDYHNVNEIVFELTADLLALFAAPNNGFIMQGDNATAKKVELYRAPSGPAGYALTMTNETAGNGWDTQVWYTLDAPLKAGAQYEFKCVVKSTVARDWCSVLLQSADGADQNFNHGMNLFTEWTPTTIVFSPDKDTYTKVTFNVGDFVGVVSIDNVSMKEVGSDVELIKNGNFDDGSLAGWSSWTNAQGLGEGYAE